MIIADIPTERFSNRTSGYSRGGQWHTTFECGGYENDEYPAPYLPFSDLRLKYQKLAAEKSVSEQRQLERWQKIELRAVRIS